MRHLHQLLNLAPVVAGTALLFAPAGGRAAEDLTVSTFDTADTVPGKWTKWWGSASQTMEWDGSVDANGNAESGSLKVTVGFDLAAYGGDNQFAIYAPFPLTDGSQYKTLELDILWDPSSPHNADGTFGWLEPGFRNQDWSQNWLGGLNAANSNDSWTHLSLPINDIAPKIDTINGVVLKMWSGDAKNGFTGTTVFWVDNIRLIAKEDTSAPPPTLQTTKAVAGLNLFASAAGSQYQRQSVRTKTPAYGWVGASAPVTYSITIADYPDNAHSGFQTHLFLVPGTAIPTWETAPDWNEANVIFLDIENNAGGGANAAFRYKVNQPNGNAMIYGSGTLANVGGASVVGTWTLAFDPSGDITLTSPDGNSKTFQIPPDDAALFAGGVYAYLGAQPNQLGNIGLHSVISRLQITGVETPVDETFSGDGVDKSVWDVIADDAAGVVGVPADTLLWLSWTLPDKGFNFQVAPALDGSSWADFDPAAFQLAGMRRALIRSSTLPASATGSTFFRLFKPE